MDDWPPFVAISSATRNIGNRIETARVGPAPCGTDWDKSGNIEAHHAVTIRPLPMVLLEHSRSPYAAYAQKRTLSIRVSEELREFLERSCQPPVDPLIHVGCRQHALGVWQTRQPDCLFEIANLRLSPSLSLLTIRSKWELKQQLSVRSGFSCPNTFKPHTRTLRESGDAEPQRVRNAARSPYVNSARNPPFGSTDTTWQPRSNQRGHTE